ncbi:hypothetical protein, partial [Novosphingobium sp. BW1]|uniref:hypothetical protein n=1 Tax=Novosphingobium sp. BW1 TaxID=2592621 RepID=UPI0011DEA613
MSFGLTFLLRMRIWALLLLAAIGLQAAEPIRAPLERAPGSAWSSATSDLALSPSRRGEDGAQDVAPQPPQPLPDRSAGRLSRHAPAVLAALLLAPRAQSPPAQRHPARRRA